MAIEYQTLTLQWMGCILFSTVFLCLSHLDRSFTMIFYGLMIITLSIQLWMNSVVTENKVDFIKANCISLGIPILAAWYVHYTNMLYFDQFKSSLRFLLFGC